MELTVPFLLALLLGLKHSVDADHVAAMATYVSRSPSTRGALSLGLHWAAGHVITASALTILLFLFRDAFLSRYLEPLQLAVGTMLILLGALALRDLSPRRHAHMHAHGRQEHTHPHLHAGSHAHRHLLGVGIVHGLASNDELLILFTLSVGLSSLFGVVAGLLVFNAGVVLGAAVFSTVLSLPAVRGGSRIRAALVGGSGVASVLYGFLILGGFA